MHAILLLAAAVAAPPEVWVAKPAEPAAHAPPRYTVTAAGIERHDGVVPRVIVPGFQQAGGSSPVVPGPDGWLYLCGAHGLYRCRADGSKLEQVNRRQLHTLAFDDRGQPYGVTDAGVVVPAADAGTLEASLIPWTDDAGGGFVSGVGGALSRWTLEPHGASCRPVRTEITVEHTGKLGALVTDARGLLLVTERQGRTLSVTPPGYVEPAAEGEAKKLSHPQLTVRTFAVWDCITRTWPGPVPSLWADADAPATARVAAAAVMAGRGADAETFRPHLADLSPLVRERAAVHVGEQAAAGSEVDHTALVPLLADNEATVQHGAILAIGRIGAPAAPDVIVNVWRNHDGKDVALGGAMLRAFDLLGSRGAAALVDMAASGSDRDRDLAVEAVCRLQGEHVGAAALPLLDNPHVTPDQRVQLVRALAVAPTFDAAALEAYLKRHPDEGDELKQAARRAIDGRKK